MPLSVEERWLGLYKMEGSLMDGFKITCDMLEKMIHILFGCRVILLITKLYADHYGQKNIIKLYAVHSETIQRNSFVHIRASCVKSFENQ